MKTKNFLVLEGTQSHLKEITLKRKIVSYNRELNQTEDFVSIFFRENELTGNTFLQKKMTFIITYKLN